MDHFLNWYSLNNKNVILVLSTCIGLGLIYFIYRMLFVMSSPEKMHGSDHKTKPQDKNSNHFEKSNTEIQTPTVKQNDKIIEKLNEKVIDKLDVKLDAKSNEENTSSEKRIESVGIAANEKKEFEDIQNQLKEKIDELQKSLNLSNKDLDQSKSELAKSKKDLMQIQEELANVKSLAKSNQEPAGIQYVDTAQLVGDEALIKKIDELQSKLQEYDIISEDIAEIQSLRKSNADLRRQLSEKE